MYCLYVVAGNSSPPFLANNAVHVLDMPDSIVS